MTENADFVADIISDRRGPVPLPAHLGMAMLQYTLLESNGLASKPDLEKMISGIQKYQKHPYTES